MQLLWKEDKNSQSVLSEKQEETFLHFSCVLLSPSKSYRIMYTVLL